MDSMAIASKRLHWRKLSIFIALTVIWSCLAACMLYAVRKWLPGTHADMAVIGFYSFTPMISALIADGGWVSSRLSVLTRKTVASYILLPAFIFVAFLLSLTALTYVFGNMLFVNAMGAVSLTLEQLHSLGIVAQTHSENLYFSLAFYGVLVAGAIIAGWTFYGIFGLGEEYGWRGFLWDELKPLGVVNANVVTGVLWGLWHMPLVLSAYTYGNVGLIGLVAIITFTISMSFILSALRGATGSVIPAAALHGMINSASYLGALVIIPGNTLIGGLGGVVSSLTMIVIGVAMWLYIDRRSVPTPH